MRDEAARMRMLKAHIERTKRAWEEKGEKEKAPTNLCEVVLQHQETGSSKERKKDV